MSESERDSADGPPMQGRPSSHRPARLGAGWPAARSLWLLGPAAARRADGRMLVGIALAVAYPNLPEISGLTDYRPKLPMRVFSADGVLLGEFGEERRNFTPIAADPQGDAGRGAGHRGRALLSAQRRRLQGRAARRPGQPGPSRSQGASTITMQVARNFYLSTEKTFTRKIYEMLLAFKIESLLTKDQILEIYMNQIFLGQRAYGFAAASEIYFGKPLKDITIAEAAMLAGLPKAPSAYNPIVNPSARRAPALHHRPHARERLHHAEQHEQRASQPLKVPRAPSESRCTPSTWPRWRASWSSRSTATTPTRAA
jgi:penicillin-binding protein 1A